jgi:hypothetical protein
MSDDSEILTCCRGDSNIVRGLRAALASRQVVRGRVAAYWAALTEDQRLNLLEEAKFLVSFWDRGGRR